MDAETGNGFLRSFLSVHQWSTHGERLLELPPSFGLGPVEGKRREARVHQVDRSSWFDDAQKYQHRSSGDYRTKRIRNDAFTARNRHHAQVKHLLAARISCWSVGSEQLAAFSEGE